MNKSMTTSKNIIQTTMIFLLLFLFINDANSQNILDNTNNINSNNVNIAAGVPIRANDSACFIIYRPQYVVSVSKELSVANWASWHLSKNNFGTTKRYQGQFITDTLLPDEYYRVKHSDYTNTGYDRGHLVRSDERTTTEEDNKATFFLTNIIPQTPDLNRLVWLQFEEYLKQLCIRYNKQLYIVAGGVFHSKQMLKDKIGVPDSCWKVVLILDSNQTIKNVNRKTKTIAVMMPNIENLKERKWSEFITTVGLVEKSTGYDFFNLIDKKIQKIIEYKKYLPEIDETINKEKTSKSKDNKLKRKKTAD